MGQLNSYVYMLQRRVADETDCCRKDSYRALPRIRCFREPRSPQTGITILRTQLRDNIQERYGYVQSNHCQEQPDIQDRTQFTAIA